VTVIDESVHGTAAGPLEPHVAWYAGFRQAGVRPTMHRGLPSPQLTLIFALDEPTTVARHPDPRQGPADYDTLLGGLHTGPVLISHQGRQSGVQVGIDPLGARALLGLPAGELAGAVIPADAVLGRVGARLRERLAAAGNWPERFALLDRVLPGAARAYGAVPPEVAHAWRLLLAGGGRIPVSALAREVGWSERHLSGRFRTEIGLTPKAAARVVRFDRAQRLLVARTGMVGPGRALRAEQQHAHPQDPSQAADRRGYTRLADLAVECGYFDQAHLTREFRALAGCAPIEWLSTEFRNIQAGSPGSDADWS
jgi:AraC-like DNA-binding protein